MKDFLFKYNFRRDAFSEGEKITDFQTRFAWEAKLGSTPVPHSNQNTFIIQKYSTVTNFLCIFQLKSINAKYINMKIWPRK